MAGLLILLLIIYIHIAAKRRKIRKYKKLLSVTIFFSIPLNLNKIRIFYVFSSEATSHCIELAEKKRILYAYYGKLRSNMKACSK